MPINLKELPIGYEFPPVTHVMTPERIRLFCDMHNSTTAGPSGRLQLSPKNIHIDADYARTQGFPNAVATGLITTAWVEAELRDLFGIGYLEGGKLTNKFIKPVFADDIVTIKMSLKEKVPEGSAIRFTLDISCCNQKGEPFVVGFGSGLVT